MLFGSTFAEIPEIISYQGRVTDSGGTPVADGNYTMRFRIYDAATGGNLEWDSGNRSIAISDGVFNVLLGESATLNLPFDEDYWLRVTFDGVDQTPRQRLASAGYAYMASGLVPGTVVDGAVNSGSYAAIRANNTATSGTRYGLRADVSSSSGRALYGNAVSTSGSTYGVYGRSVSTSGTAVRGSEEAVSGQTYGVWGSSNSNHAEAAGVYGVGDNRGVYGRATDTSGNAYGGYFESSSSSGRGVYGYASHTSGTTYGGKFDNNSTNGMGVAGFAAATTGVVCGGYFESASNQASAVRAFATSTTGSYATYGVYGRSYASSDGSIGVYGRSSYNSNDGVTYGVYGRSDGRNDNPSANDPAGVYGLHSNASSTYGFGGYFDSNASLGIGVAGDGQYVGVRAYAVNGYGLASAVATGSAGYFDGDVEITGTLSKGGGSFLIDHPLDPENKLLRHNFVESPENLLIYRGTVKLDPHGEAVVEMPEYFEALTKENEASVHLTPEGKPFLTGYRWQADHTAFTAYGDPNREVAWMVMADRDDPVIHQLARPVEEEKGPDNKVCDRGQLLYPEAYGYPETMGKGHEIFTAANVQPVEEPEDLRPTAAGEPVEPDRTSDDADVMEVDDARQSSS
jgi:hypothetical protein